jgi:hypothetical protein
MSNDRPVDWAIRFTASFEAELLAEFMLRTWHHPYCQNENYRESLLESSAEALFAAQRGEVLMEDVSPEEMTFVTAIWYVESCDCESSIATDDPKITQQRRDWLTKVRRSIPSCFCESDDLL